MQISRRYDGVVFDMDGTVIEPMLDFGAIRSDLGIPPDKGVLEAIAEMSTPDRVLAEGRLREHELAAAREAGAMPGAIEVLSVIRSAGLKTALLTRNSREATKIVLERFDRLRFDLTLCREDGAIKPAPDGVLEACRELGIAPAQTVCVGDYHYDIIAANSAGAVSVLLLSRLDRPEWIAEADYRIDRLDELKDILEL